MTPVNVVRLLESGYDGAMRERLTSHWWLFLVRGILALALGIAVPFFPGAALFTIAILFGVYAILDGIAALYAAFRMTHADGRWGWLFVEGIAGLAAGGYALVFPGAAVFALAWLLGAWALITGILALGSAFSARRHLGNEWLWALTGALSIVFGIAVFFAPALGVIALIYFFSFYAIVAGVLFIGLALRLRHLAHPTSGGSTHAPV